MGGFFGEALLNFEYKEDEKSLVPFSSELNTVTIYEESYELLIALEYIVKTLIKQWKIKHIVIGVSGGIDSALSACLFSRVLGPQNLTLVNMPTRYNSKLTQNASKLLSRNLERPYISFGLEEILEVAVKKFQGEKLDFSAHNYENFQARTRGSLVLATISSVLEAVFPCNVNKTELTVGYGTLYGDLSGFLSPLGDLWKNQVYALARVYNDKVFKKEIIPEEVFQIPPSAELSEKQDISKGLGDPLVYEYHDALFKSWVESWSKKNKQYYLDAYKNAVLYKTIGCQSSVIKKAFKSEKEFLSDFEKWWELYNGLAKFKRVQSAPIVSVSKRSFGYDLRESLGV
jgi:NAD+ synthase (glutamine-hydrolysing)